MKISDFHAQSLQVVKKGMVIYMKQQKTSKRTGKSNLQWISEYKGTTIIIGICLFLFIIDIILRCLTGEIGFIDLLLGRNAYIGTHEFLWFKMHYFLDGQIWRVVSWMFWSQGILHFLAETTVLCLLCAALEKWIGSLKLVFTYIILGLVILLASFLVICARNGSFFIDYGMSAGTLSMIYAIAGVVLTLAFTGGDKEEKRFTLKSYTFVFTAVLFTAVYIYYIYTGIDRFFHLYPFSFGVLTGLIFSKHNQNTFVLESAKRKDGFPPVTKTKAKKYIGTLSIIGLSTLIFILNAVMINKDILIELYGEANVISWLKCFWNKVDACENLSDWIFNMNTAMVNQGQIWRFFTNVFSHYGLEHMLFNMPVIYFTGKYIEPKIGTIKWVAVFLCSSFVASMSWYLTGANMISTGGSSLGLYAFIALYFLYSFEKGNQIRSRAYEFIFIFIYFMIGNIPGIGVWGEGHLTSFATGYIAIFIIKVFNKNSKEVSNRD
jgi:membrane associated rhomboid family serine protease